MSAFIFFFVGFFFFKQKTAYEMRISDWSSDVCSSDLWQMLATRSPASGQWRHYPAIMRPEAIFAWAEPGRAYAGQVVEGDDGRYYFYASVVEIGRASCRERVCQYV